MAGVVRSRWMKREVRRRRRKKTRSKDAQGKRIRRKLKVSKSAWPEKDPRGKKQHLSLYQ